MEGLLFFFKGVCLHCPVHNLYKVCTNTSLYDHVARSTKGTCKCRVHKINARL